jgi:hypothetical protein
MIYKNSQKPGHTRLAASQYHLLTKNIIQINLNTPQQSRRRCLLWEKL